MAPTKRIPASLLDPLFALSNVAVTAIAAVRVHVAALIKSSTRNAVCPARRWFSKQLQSKAASSYIRNSVAVGVGRKLVVAAARLAILGLGTQEERIANDLHRRVSLAAVRGVGAVLATT